MKINYSVEIKERAQHLYCCCGHNLRAVAELTGVNLRTVKDWSVKCGWAEKRSEYVRTLIETRTNLVLLRNKLVEHCLESLNPKEAIALLSLESQAGKKYGEDRSGSDLLLTPGSPCSTDNDQDAAAAIEKAYRIRATLLSIFPGRLVASEIKG